MLRPVDRATMKSFKANKEEEKRIIEVKRIIETLYKDAITVAKDTEGTSYKYQVPLDDFHRTNLDEIINTLKTLFPDSSVEYLTLSRELDGKMYDISKIPIAHNNIQDCYNYIVIDWS